VHGEEWCIRGRGGVTREKVDGGKYGRSKTCRPEKKNQDNVFGSSLYPGSTKMEGERVPGLGKKKKPTEGTKRRGPAGKYMGSVARGSPAGSQGITGGIAFERSSETNWGGGGSMEKSERTSGVRPVT